MSGYLSRTRPLAIKLRMYADTRARDSLMSSVSGSPKEMIACPPARPAAAGAVVAAAAGGVVAVAGAVVAGAGVDPLGTSVAVGPAPAEDGGRAPGPQAWARKPMRATPPV